jgi:DNA-3-methyladenine glycosylase II
VQNDAATILDSDASLKAGLDALVGLDPVMARLVDEGALPRLRFRPAGFEGLAFIVVGQQVSTASANAIWGRVKECFPVLTLDTVLAASDEDLRGPGLSGPKIRTLRAVASAIVAGDLALDALATLPADEAHASLCRVKGIGPWTADVYLLFCLGHPDAYDLPSRPSVAELIAIAERWRPWRGVAAKVLWALYRIAKARDGAPLGA